MNKAVLSKQQADSLESAIKCSNGDKASIIDWKVRELFSGDEESLNKVGLDDLIRALYIGYEVFEVPENCGIDVMGDEIVKGDYILEHDNEIILETNAIDYLVDFLGAARKVAGE